MKLVIFSGAGISIHSGLPSYQSIKNDKNYQQFFLAEKEEAINIAEQFYQKYSACKPNKVHHQCCEIEDYCEILGIEFHHYTLNVDDLIEQAGSNATHIYGCIDDFNTLIEHRSLPNVDMSHIAWEKDDILVVIGVSNDGYPLAHLESQVLANGADFYNYNLANNKYLSSKTIVGDLIHTFSSLSIASLLQCEFEVMDIGVYEVEIKSFAINGRRYEIYFSPSYDAYSCPDETQAIEDLTDHKLTKNAYEVKFDLAENREKEQQFEPPTSNFDLKALSRLGLVLASTIEAHSNFKGGELYTASAAHNNLVKYYNRLAKRYSVELKYQKWCEFGPYGVNYAFKKC